METVPWTTGVKIGEHHFNKCCFSATGTRSRATRTPGSVTTAGTTPSAGQAHHLTLMVLGYFQIVFRNKSKLRVFLLSKPML